MLRVAQLVLFLIALAFLVTFDARAADRPDILEVMSIDGVIDDGMAARITKQVEEINDNPRVKGVLLVVDSPGGGVLASSVIYEELAKLKVPVVGWCNNICASGGMYVLMSPAVKYIGVRTTTIWIVRTAGRAVGSAVKGIGRVGRREGGRAVRSLWRRRSSALRLTEG